MKIIEIINGCFAFVVEVMILSRFDKKNKQLGLNYITKGSVINISF